ncbi:MAG TPA: VWA domain-containing protein [Pyrinomonadaceae bacterium]|nr:VWA domain-containing protein [Pyrinomonadaceae bacterium]
MISLHRYLFLAAFVLTSSFGVNSYGQGVSPTPPPVPNASPTPTPAIGEPQDTIRVSTEEVRIPIFANDEYGHFDPTLELDDVLILEDGVAQEIKSLERVPGNVLLLLCTSGDANPAMRTNMTRDIALNLVSHLRAGDRISILQFTSRVELLQDWTDDKSLVEHVLRTKLHSGRGTRLIPAVTRATAELQKQPPGNRHVVIVGDGVDLPPWADYKEMMAALSPPPQEAETTRAALAAAIRQLGRTGATLHMISYRLFANEVFAGRQQKDTGSTGIRFDPQMRRLNKAYQNAMQKSGESLAKVVEQSGGFLLEGESADEMVKDGAEIARDIGTQYVATYKPRRPLASARPGEYRELKVVSRRVGLSLSSRRGYVVNGGAVQLQP